MTLVHQAEVAEAYGNPQLGDNFRRAAELTRFDDEEVLGVHEALRPGRSSPEALATPADSFEARPAPLVAALIREAAEVYRRRGLVSS